MVFFTRSSSENFFEPSDFFALKTCSQTTSFEQVSYPLLSFVCCEMFKLLNLILFLMTETLLFTGKNAKEFPLPRIFWPEAQEIFLRIDFERDVIISLVNITLKRTDFEASPKIVLNSAGLKIKQINVSIPSKCSQLLVSENVSYNLIPKREQIEIALEKTEVREAFLEMESEATFSTNKKLLTGAYHPYSTHDIVTQFETVFARTVFPCFDDPHFRTKFSLSIQLQDNFPSDFGTVLFNAPLQNYHASSRTYHFKQTPHAIPSYLLSFAVLNSNVYKPVLEMEFSLIPITFYEHSYESAWKWESIYGDEVSREVIKSVVKFTLSYCEKLFQSKFDWPKLDFLVTQSSFGGMENPGLVILRDYRLGLSKNLIATE